MYNMIVTGIILLAGNSTRYNKGYNKNLEILDNQPVFMYSLKAFLNNKLINDIILVVRYEDKKEIESYLNNITLNKKVNLIIGGLSRMESVYNGIINSTSDLVVIHDGARPLIKDSYITKGIESMNKYLGAVTSVKVKDTIKITNNYGEIVSSTNRDYTYIGQTPQTFNRQLLLELHQKYKNNLDITDDSMLFEKEGYKIKIIEGDYTNIKITTEEDLELAKIFLKNCKIINNHVK